LFTQTDSNWSGFEIIPGYTIKEGGCLLTSLSNILVDLGLDYNPLTLCKKLQANKGFDNIGEIEWSVLNNLFGLSEIKYSPNEKIVWSDSNKVWYIVQMFYQNTGHFCNIVSVKNNIIYYFDVYDGINKQVNIERTMSIRQVTQQ